MIVDKITLKINKSNIKHFINKGYGVSLGDIIEPSHQDINKGSHTKILCECDNCGTRKTMEFRVYYKITNGISGDYYCKKCSYIKNKRTNQEKYGTEHPMQNKDVIKKLLSTNNDRYGVNSASMLEEIKQKQKRTNQERYGSVSPLQNKDVKYRQKLTMVEKYGVEYPLQNNIIKEKTKQTNINLYGVDNPMKNGIIYDKFKATLNDNYGVDNPMYSEDIIKKVNDTKSKKLKVKYPLIKYVDYNTKLITMGCDNGL